MTAKAKRPLTPMTVRSSEICSLSHDNVMVGEYSISVDPDQGKVYLGEQTLGEPPRQQIELPRSIFNKLIRWYVFNRVPREDARSRRGA